jgi:ElaB/YqjD/DUF883 family membrane-anchored ribosome-binding protein
MNENPTTSEAEEIGQTTNFGTSKPSTGTSTQMQDRAQELADRTKEAASEYGQKAQERMDKGMDQAAEGMERAAEKLRTQADNVDGMPAQAGVKLADGMETAATYLRDHNTDELLNDVEHYVRQHPTQALVGAIFAGFFIGRVLR